MERGEPIGPLTQNLGSRHGPALARSGWESRRLQEDGESVNKWFPPGYVDPRLSELLASTSPFLLSLSEGNRYGPALKKAGWLVRGTKELERKVNKWFPPGYVDPRLSELLASTSPISLSPSEASRYGPTLKKAGWAPRREGENGIYVSKWFPPGYADPRLSELLASTSPFSLSASEAARYWPALKKAGWTNRLVGEDGIDVSKWFPPDYADPRLSELLASTSPISLSMSEANRYKHAIKKEGWTPRRVRENRIYVSKWFPPDRP